MISRSLMAKVTSSTAVTDFFPWPKVLERFLAWNLKTSAIRRLPRAGKSSAPSDVSSHLLNQVRVGVFAADLAAFDDAKLLRRGRAIGLDDGAALGETTTGDHAVELGRRAFDGDR